MLQSINHLEPSTPVPEKREKGLLENKISWLERQLRRYVGAPHCVVTPDAVSGLRLALQAAGVEKGDTVLCTTFGQYSTLQTIVDLGAQPEFVDINPNSYNLDPYCLDYVIRKYHRNKAVTPKALVALDLFGLPCNYTAIEETCEHYGIELIEDMTQAFGASVDGRRAGQFGRFAVASLGGAKVPGSLHEDGAVFCHNPEDEQRLRDLLTGLPRPVPEEAGEATLEAEQAELRAHLTVVGEQLRSYRREFERRQKVAGMYRERLAGHIRMQLVGERFESAYTQFVVSLQDNDMRAFVMDRLVEEQIPCSIFYPIPLHLRQEVGAWNRVILANAELVSGKLLVLPMHSYLTAHVVDYICERLLAAVDLYTHRQALPEMA